MAAGNGAEALISREEQPQDPSKYGARVVLPPLTPERQSADARPSVSRRPTSHSAASDRPEPGDEPRKIKTAARSAPIRPTPPRRPVAPPPRPHHAARRRPRRRTPAAARSPTPMRPPANAPLSLSPQAEPRDPRLAATAPLGRSRRAAAAMLVQVSSQRSEADAQASFRALQGKFPSVLGSRAPLIKRADLGDKGVYYRAMVGPFGSPDEAAQFCGNLKTAGGQCVVQRN